MPLSDISLLEVDIRAVLEFLLVLELLVVPLIFLLEVPKVRSPYHLRLHPRFLEGVVGQIGLGSLGPVR